MGRQDDRKISLAIAHSRFKLAADTLRWAVNAESAKVIDRDGVAARVQEIEDWADQTWRALTEDERGNKGKQSKDGRSD